MQAVEAEEAKPPRFPDKVYSLHKLLLMLVLLQVSDARLHAKIALLRCRLECQSLVMYFVPLMLSSQHCRCSSLLL